MGGETKLTLIIAAQGKDFVVLGCDSRGTIQDYTGTKVGLDKQQKLFQITDNVGVLLVGDAGQASYIIETYRRDINSKLKNVTEIAEDFAQFCRSQERITHDLPPAHELLFGFIIAGTDGNGNQVVPRCFSLKNTTGFRLGLYNHGFGIEGKPFIANYLFAKYYCKEMDLDTLAQLVVGALSDTIQFDGDVGGKITLAIIADSSMRVISQGDIETKIRRWDVEYPILPIDKN